MDEPGVVIRPSEERDLDAIVRLQRAADDSRVVSTEGFRHWQSTRPERARALELVAELDGEVVAHGVSGLNTNTTTPGAAWAFLTVDAASRRHGLGDRLGSRFLQHLADIGANKATSFFRRTEEGERWALARGWSRLMTAPLIALDPRTVPGAPAPPGFRCVSLSDLGPADVFSAVAAAALDEPSPVPNDDTRFEDFLREWDDPDLDLDASMATLDDDGRVAAFAFIKTVGDRAQHGFTGTLREYRGQGLATAAKRAALREAAARGVTRVTTMNAEENAAMRAINRNLGFEPIGEHVILGRDLSAAGADARPGTRRSRCSPRSRPP